MRKILFIFSLILASISSSLGQNNITESEFNSLVDYANSKYVMAFINKKDAANKDYFELYQKNLEPILVAASLDSLEQVIGFEELKHKLDNNKPAQKLIITINDRKDDYNKIKTDKELINLLSASSWEQVDLQKTSLKIQRDITNKYMKIASNEEIDEFDEIGTTEPEITTPEVELHQPQSKHSKSTSELSEMKQTVHTFKLLFFIVFVLFVVVFIALIWLIRNIQKNDFNKIQSKLDKRFLKTKDFNITYKSLVHKQEEITKKLLKFETQKDNNKSIETHHSTLGAENQTQTIVSKEIHFKTKNGKVLQEVLPSSKDSAFKVYDIKNNEAKFKYCGGVVNPDFFDGVCDFENNPADVQTKTKIETITPGIVKKDNKGNWVVETPATIKFL